MEEPLAPEFDPIHAPPRFSLLACSDRTLLLVLAALAALIHGWLLCHTEVAARDSIGYIRYAWQLEHRPWDEVMRQADQHPGYPLAVLAVSVPVRQLLPGSDAVLMQLSAQLVSAIAGVLLVIPMFQLGRELFDRRVAFWSSLLFQYLPASSRVLADGLSEALFLLFAVTALWLAARALRHGSPWLCGLCGLSGGLAYLTRPEGALIVVATGLVLVALQLQPGWRRPWSRLTWCALCLVLPALAVGGPYALVTGRLSNKPTVRQLTEEQPAAPEAANRPAGATMGQGPVFADLFAVWGYGNEDIQTDRRLWAMRAIALELSKGFNYIGWLPALLGLWWTRYRWRLLPGAWVLLAVCATLLVALWRVAWGMGYFSDRHALLVILAGTYWMVAGLCEFPEQLADFLGRWPPGRWHDRFLGWAAHPATPVVLLLVVAAIGLPKSLETLHYDRSGFREAGQWLGRNTAPTDPILDPYCWSHYYAGRVFVEGEATKATPDHVPARYVVIEHSHNPHARLPELAEAERLEKHGDPVFVWTGWRKNETVEVVVYRVPLTVH